MKINWTVRFKNPVFWKNIALSVIAPVVTYLGLKTSDLTTWGAVLDVLKAAVLNPVILVSVVVSVLNAINDPTTAGYSDSLQALSYTEPKKI